MPIHLLPETPNRPELSRRAFLGRAAAAASALALGRQAGAAADTPWYALVSDTHLAADPATKARNQNMADNLRKVVDDIRAFGGGTRPRGMFIDGDLAQKDGQIGDYRTLLSLIDPVRKAEVPVHLTLGNHDHRINAREAANRLLSTKAEGFEKVVSVVEGPNVRFLLLDSLDVVNATPGTLGEKQIGWVAKTLDEKPEVPAVLVVHHPPVEHPAALTDTAELFKAIRPRRQAKAIVFGHSHVWDVRKDGDIHLINLPAVGYPFAAEQPLGWCVFRPEADGASLELRPTGGNLKPERLRVDLKWRSA